jgi:hypothetical protein
MILFRDKNIKIIDEINEDIIYMQNAKYICNFNRRQKFLKIKKIKKCCVDSRTD